MANEVLTILTNKFIDKELSKSEELQLLELLKDNDNKHYFDSLTNTLNTLEQNKPTEKQIFIKDNVLINIAKRNNQTISTKIKNYFTEWLNGSLSSYAASFAIGGFFVALILLLLPVNTQIKDTFMQGTISNRNIDETVNLSESLFSGAIKVQYPENVVILDIDLNSSEKIDCALIYDKDQLSFYGVKAVKSNGYSNFLQAGNSIKLSDICSNHYLVFFKRVTNNYSKINTSFFIGNEQITNITLEINN
ncbi:MAG: hypothetical protein V1773_17440 [bacterium]